MKTRNVLKKYLEKREAKITALLDKPNQKFTQDDFHDLRVEIKKTRSLAAMLEATVKNFNAKKILKPLEKIFSQAGKVRELQLEEAMLHKHDPRRHLKTYEKNLSLMEENEKKDYSVVHQKVQNKVGKTFNDIYDAIKKTNKKAADKYVSKEKKELVSLVRPRALKIAKVHELRKGLKTFNYNTKSLRDNNTVFKNADALQDMMGKWHDHRVMNKHLLKAADNHMIASSEKEPILRIADRLYLKSQELYRQINDEKQKAII